MGVNLSCSGRINLLMKHLISLVGAALSLILGFSAPATSGEPTSGWVKTDQTSVRLVAASQTTGNSTQIQLGLHFKLKPGWKVYWRSAGDAGFPPQLDWTGSRNLMNAEISWPTPERFSVLGLETLGYKKEVVFPITARTILPEQDLNLKLALKYLTCSEICIPYDTELSLTLPVGPPSPSAFAHLIDRFRAIVPGNGRSHGLEIVSAEAQESATWTGLRVTATSSTPFNAPDVFVEGIAGLAYAKPKISLSADKRQAVMDVGVDGLKYLDDKIGKTLAGRSFILTLADGLRSAEKTIDVALGKPNEIPTSTPPPALSLITILGLAVLGGLILNLMPCVLPVLSLKLIGAVSHGGGESRTVRMSFIASAAGILFSFMVLAGVLVALKASGGAIGWGIQFQQPWFLIAMAVMVILFACNLWDFFDVGLPRFIADLSGHSSQINGLGGHFAQGAFATILATPCSAPFLGTAVGFALARGPQEIFSVFAALGLGLALPYLAVALFPGLATRLPKPGAWMIRMKHVLGFALLATALWLMSVLYATTSMTNTVILGALLLALIFTLYLAHRFPVQKQKTRFIATILVLVAVLLPATFDAKQKVDISTYTSDIKWKTFDQDAVGRMVAAGHTVLVDVTADWCITCQVNKAVVLGRDPVSSLLKNGTVEPMQADWTQPDDDIAKYLASFGLYGIPFNAVYGPGAPGGIVLPELLTQDAVLEAVKAASVKKTAATSIN